MSLTNGGSRYYGLYNSIGSALSAAVSGQTVNVPSGGSCTISSDLTVPAGVTLQIASGCTLSFSGSYKLHVEGKLVASSTTFTRSGGQWYGIEFYYGTSGSSMDYCTVENAQYGLSLIGTSPSVSNCTIQNNSSGVYSSGTYSSFLWNVVENNSYGFNLTSYGDPTISHNILRYNSYAVYGDATSVPTMGGISGSNSFNYTDYYDVYTSYSGTINAQSNWWYPWAPSFYGNVDYSNYLSSDPNLWASKVVPAHPILTPMLAKMSPVSTDSLAMKEIDQACQLLLNGSQDQALEAFQSIVNRYPDAFAGGRALAFVDHIMEKANLDVEQSLASTITQHPNSRVGLVATSLMTGHLVKEGNCQNAQENATSLIGNSDKMIAKQALYDAGSITWYRLGDKAKATGYFRTLIATYPQDPLSISALATLGEWVGGVLPNGQGSAQAQDNSKIGMLLQNYPNPFNPSTMICYALPTDGLTSLRVFDILGRVVAVLVNEFEQAGVHEVRFDASSLPSGVYVYRLDFGRKSIVQKMLMLK